ncbi:MAG TPA: helix-turn-helix domain-containing protein [Chryseosolibacter sp.]
MKKEMSGRPHRFESLSEVHRMLELPPPVHPLISLIEIKNTEIDPRKLPPIFVYNFYKISLKLNLRGKIKYGQGYYDFQEGGMFFKGPNQVSGAGDHQDDHAGFTMIIHPDFFLNYPLAKKIKQYGFFSYSVNEALHLSEKEKLTIISIFKNIDEELQNRIDDFSHDVIISQIETLLNYSNRFYKRQFITRKPIYNSLLERFENILDEYFEDETLVERGVPTVQYLAETLNLSPSYLSDMLRSLTGQSAQHHIHEKLVEKAKEKIATTNLTISQIAFGLGFEHLSSFNKLFKAKTNLSPLQFRRTFN